MKRKVYHTLLIITPTSGKDILQISLTTFWWRALSAVAGLLLILAFAGIWIGFHHYHVAVRADNLEDENRIALSKVENQKQEIKFLQDNLKKIQNQSIFIQEYLGLNSNGDSKGNLGQGGSEIPMAPLSDLMEQSALPDQNLPSADFPTQSSKLTRQNIQQLDTNLNQIILALESRQTELAHTPSISPIEPKKAWISCGYGKRKSPFTGKIEMHPGIDIAGWKGTPVIAPADGTVVFSQRWGSMGRTVKIKHNSTYLTTFGHLLKANVKKGQSVKRGDIIAYMGNSGRSTGYHLHYEVYKKGKRLNPLRHMLDWDGQQLLLASGGEK